MISQFAQEKFLLLLPLVPGFALLGYFLYQRSDERLRKAFGLQNAKRLTQSLSKFQRTMKLVLQSLVLGLFVLALARPQGNESEVPVVAEGVEVVFMVDVSESMLAEDVRPSRLAQARAELSRLIDLLPGHKVGIVAFAGSATLVSPLSVDPGALKMYLESLSPLAVSTQGTDFRSGLQEAEAAFQRGGAGKDPGIQVTRVILIASDGEDQEPGALDHARKMADSGIRIFSLVYGTEKGGPIPLRDSTGLLKGYKKDGQGQTVLTTVRGDALRNLAEAGRGAFHFASFGGNHLRAIVEDINKLEKTKFETKATKQYEEQFQFFLLIAFILAVLELLISGRAWKSQTVWRGRFEIEKN